MTRILVIEDHPLVATGLQLTLRARGHDVEQVSGPTRQAVLDFAAEFAPDCVLLDLRLAREVGHGADLIPGLLKVGAEIVVVTAETDELTLGECVEAGAAGWVSKSAHVDEVARAVEDVIAGRPLLTMVARETLLDRVRARRSSLQSHRSVFDQLTGREEMVLAGMVDGLSADEIAELHVVSISTVRSQIRSILQKLGVRSQLAAVVQANRAGWTPDRGPGRADFINSDDAVKPDNRDC